MKTLAFILRSLFTTFWQLALGVPVLLVFVLGFFLARGIDDDFAYNVYHTFLLLSEVLGPLAGLYLLDRSMKKETQKREKAEEGRAKEAVAATREEPVLAVEESTPASEEPAPLAAEAALTEEENTLPAYVAPAVVDFEPAHYNPTTGLPMVDESSGIDVGGHLLDEVEAQPVQMQLFN